MKVVEKRAIRNLVSRGILRGPTALTGISLCVDFRFFENPPFCVWLEGRHADVVLSEILSLNEMFDFLGIEDLMAATDYFMQVLALDMAKKARKIEKEMAAYREA